MRTTIRHSLNGVCKDLIRLYIKFWHAAAHIRETTQSGPVSDRPETQSEKQEIPMYFIH